jgi:hypothetical protein
MTQQREQQENQMNYASWELPYRLCFLERNVYLFFKIKNKK